MGPDFGRPDPDEAEMVGLVVVLRAQKGYCTQVGVRHLFHFFHFRRGLTCWL